MNQIEAVLIAVAEPALNRQGGRFGRRRRYLQVRDKRLGPTESEMIQRIYDGLGYDGTQGRSAKEKTMMNTAGEQCLVAHTRRLAADGARLYVRIDTHDIARLGLTHGQVVELNVGGKVLPVVSECRNPAAPVWPWVVD